ncbi:RDD family protein [Natrinema halophilum]|uniref:RDD family protein n=1 Tax=Natrinema halophilum TaxID=1699371 RepID=A0A7D5GIV2_9EURY|nr:RDD family protein [Natrinema halophilum]QLG50168.1 RDD family protein [Natrinema halophilum]
MSVLDWLPTKRRPTPDLESASPVLLRRRAVATIIDLVVAYVAIETVVLAGLMVAFSDYFVANGGEAMGLSIIGLVPVYLLYTFAFEWRYGTTPGKKRMGLLVATEDGSKPGLVPAATRNALRYVDFLPVGYLIGWIFARRSPRGRRLGDRLADTLVVRPETEIEPLFAGDARVASSDEPIDETDHENS